MDEKIIKSVLKESSVITDLERLLKLRIDEKFVNDSMKLINIFDKIELKSDVITSNEILETKEQIRNIAENVQDLWEKVFSLQQRLISEGKI